MSEPEIERRTVTAAEAGSRLDAWLATQLPETSRTRVQRWIREGRVRVDGQVPRASQTVAVGQMVEVEIPAAEAPKLEAAPIPLDVLYEDDAVAVILKPAGLQVHPGAGEPRPTLAHALLARYPGWTPPGSPERPGILHRLDRDTSGLLVVARTPRAYRLLARQVAARELRRRYVALVWGKPELDAGRIDAPMGRDPRNRRRMAVVREGKEAITEWRVLRRFESATLLEVTLQTGRTHQIRVHLASRGYPVFGDPVYGGTARALQRVRREQRPVLFALAKRLSRQALHAYHLAFRHPVGGGWCRFEAPVPNDLDEVLSALTEQEAVR